MVGAGERPFALRNRRGRRTRYRDPRRQTYRETRVVAASAKTRCAEVAFRSSAAPRARAESARCSGCTPLELVHVRRSAVLLVSPRSDERENGVPGVGCARYQPAAFVSQLVTIARCASAIR